MCYNSKQTGESVKKNEGLRREGFAEKEGFKSGMRVSG